MSTEKNFPLNLKGKKITADATGTPVTLPGTTAAGKDLMIYNPGPEDVVLKTGPADMDPVDADDSDASHLIGMIIPANEKGPYEIGSEDTHISAKSLGGDQDIYVWRGNGQ